jgi:hypothetical protein
VNERAVTLVYDDAPPSLNREAGRHWSSFRRTKQRWQAIFEGLLMASELPRGLESVSATAALRFPVRRPRDEGNFRWLLEKALGDALVRGRWIADDTADRFRTGELSFEEERGPKRTTVLLTYERSGE